MDPFGSTYCTFVSLLAMSPIGLYHSHLLPVLILIPLHKNFSRLGHPYAFFLLSSFFVQKRTYFWQLMNCIIHTVLHTIEHW